ncbi:Chitin synthase, class 2 [Tulasnella sp. JGI-2019a]|nr:Chitin synthase, class 2 [Tulasnella sp. JGI-2019a]
MADRRNNAGYDSYYAGSGTQPQHYQEQYHQDSYQQPRSPRQGADPFEAQSQHSHSYEPSESHYNAPSEWDTRSVKSYHTTNSQAPFSGKSQYEMTQVNVPPVPSLHYQQPPSSQPPAPYASGYANNTNYGGAATHVGADYPPQQQYSVPARGAYAYPERPSPGRDASYAGFSMAREKMMKRRSVRKVELQQGNLVLDVPVPSHIVVNGATSDEMTKMRYTACTCDPDEFMRKKYSLRQYLYGRQTELFVVMTMYNEDEVLFAKTMNAVIKNIAHLCSRTKSKTWGPDGWKKVIVCVVSDGRNKINARTLKVLSLMGCYQEGIPKDTVGGKDVTAHIFEFTSQVMVTDTGEVSSGACPIQILFCLKEQNKKKLNSHRWFFNAFGPLIKPNVCILLDVGTKPTGTSIYELWKCFDKHPGVGGACGEICVDTGRGCGLLLTSPLAASQNFEYKMSNILDKPLESVFGYISVLPGAFSAYRYQALQNLPNGTGPLASYFKGETLHADGANGAGLFERNMYLAEDRILCFEIVTKKREAWTLKYVKSAKASTDVPTTVPEFISQRRRWLNGSFFAALHATVYWFRIWTSGQGFFRKCVLTFEFIYNAIQMLFSWTSLANFYLAFFFLVQSATAAGTNDAFNFLSQGAGGIVFDFILKLYIGLIFMILVCSLGNRPQGSKWTYTIAIILFGFCNVVTLWCAAWTVYLAVPHTLAGWEDWKTLLENQTFIDIAISLLATYGLYFISSFMHFEPWHMFTSFLRESKSTKLRNYLMLYAMCNLHDIGWGTKGDNGAAKDLGGAKKVAGKDGKEMMEVALPTVKEDVDALWAESRSALRNKPPPEKEHRDATTKQNDRDRNTRTNVVLLWVGTNMIMILVFTSTQFTNWVANFSGKTGTAFNPYLIFLFYSLAGLSFIRFFGSSFYLILRLMGH